MLNIIIDNFYGFAKMIAYCDTVHAKIISKSIMKNESSRRRDIEFYEFGSRYKLPHGAAIPYNIEDSRQRMAARNYMSIPKYEMILHSDGYNYFRRSSQIRLT